jgi:hypothetical protein
MALVFDALPYPEQALTASQHSGVGQYLLVEDWELALERAELLIAACRAATARATISIPVPSPTMLGAVWSERLGTRLRRRTSKRHSMSGSTADQRNSFSRCTH